MPTSPDLAAHPYATAPGSGAACRDYRVGTVSMTAVSDGYIVMDPGFVGSPTHPTGAFDVLKDEHNRMVMPIGCFLIRGERTVLVDLGYGPHDERNEGRMVGGGLLVQLRRLGLRPADIDVIALSHLHPDHVGWIGDPHAEATFPNAQVFVGAADWAYFVESSEALLPLEPHVRETFTCLADRGRVTLMDGDHAITPSLMRLDAPGHTPGHSIYAVHDGADRAILFGDAMYCADQLTHTDWGALTDVDRSLARRTRERFVRDLETSGGTALGCHFPGLVAGRALLSPEG